MWIVSLVIAALVACLPRLTYERRLQVSARSLQNNPLTSRRISNTPAEFLRGFDSAAAFNPSRPGVHGVNLPTGSRRLRRTLRCCCAVSDLAAGLVENLEEHAAERAASAELGFGRAAEAVPMSPPAASYKVPRTSLGMGDQCPFNSDELIFVCNQVFTASECSTVREEAAALIADGAQSDFSMTDTNRDVDLHSMPKTLRWLNDGAFARVASLAAKCFPSAVHNASDLWIYRGLVIHYDAAAGLTYQPMHRDGSLISCVVPLGERCEYGGGGTYIEPLDQSIALEQGCALLHPSAVRHSGHRITDGERWVLVLFMNRETMHPAEHGRRFHFRSQMLLNKLQENDEAEGDDLAFLLDEDDMEEEEDDEASTWEENQREEEADEENEKEKVPLFRVGDYVRAKYSNGRWFFAVIKEDNGDGTFTLEWDDGDTDDRVKPQSLIQPALIEERHLQCLLQALHMTNESNHEVWLELGMHARRHGDSAEALRCLQRAVELNPRDTLVLSNLGAVCDGLGRWRDAFRYYRRALAADPHNVEARVDAGDMLLERGRLQGLVELVNGAPEDAMWDPDMQSLAAEVERIKVRKARKLEHAAS